LFGNYNAANVLDAATAGFHFQVPVPGILEAIRDYHPSNNRSQLVFSGKNRLILDYYNANPSSMAAALTEFDRAFSSPKVAILGDMLELGSEAIREHLKVIDLLKRLSIDQIFLIGPVFSEIAQTTSYPAFSNSILAREHFSKHPFSGANILLKGSRGIHLETVRETL